KRVPFRSIRNRRAFASQLGSQAFCRRNRKWKQQLLFWHAPIFHRRVSLAPAIFFPRRQSAKPSTLARAARRASLHLQIPVRELRFQPIALSLEGGAPATPGLQQLAP